MADPPDPEGSSAPEPDGSPDPEPEGYAQAVAELDRILADIEADSVDVDVLASQVARASQLIRWCRGRIVAARTEVEAAAAALDES